MFDISDFVRVFCEYGISIWLESIMKYEQFNKKRIENHHIRKANTAYQ